MKSIKSVISLLFICVLVLANAQEAAEGVKIKDAERTIDLTSQFAKQQSVLIFQNDGSKPVSHLLLAFESPSHLSFVEVRDSEEKVLANKKTSSKNSADIYTVDLATPLKPGATAKLNVLAVYTHVIKPLPAEISQTERQFTIYKDNHYVASPYPVKTQRTTVKLASAKVEKRSELAPSSLKGDTVNYGPYEDRAPFSSSELSVHFENTKPFMAAKAEVAVEVSHWGNVAIEETYNLEHTGAHLKGVFSRLDFQRNPGASSNAITVLTRQLPLDATDVYYRDEIGNISTSNLHLGEKEHILQLGPRFPLFGGWKIGFYLGFNLPATNYLAYDANDRSRYVLSVPFAPNLKDVSFDEVVMRVILPEGASEISYNAPFSIDSQSSDTIYTYLDTVGRPVLVLTKKNVVTEHSIPIKIIYRYNSMNLLREPFLLVVAFFCVLTGVILFLRVDFHIGKTTKKSQPNTAEIDRTISVVQPIYEERRPIIADLISAVDGLKSSGQKGIENFTKQKQRSDNAVKKNATKVDEAVAKLRSAEPKFAELISELFQKQNSFVDALVDLGELHQKKVTNQVNQQNFKLQSEALQGSIDETKAAIDELEAQIF